ncbi:MAG: hypothetical protein WA491_04410, partial [Candidatus Acidiferrum sp.]
LPMTPARYGGCLVLFPLSPPSHAAAARTPFRPARRPDQFALMYRFAHPGQCSGADAPEPATEDTAQGVAARAGREGAGRGDEVREIAEGR